MKNDAAEKERNKNKRDFVIVPLTQTDFNYEKIADMVGVPVSYVEEVKASLKLSSN